MTLSPSQIGLLVKLVIAVLPFLIRLVREGQVKSAAQDELLIAIYDRLFDRIDAATRAREGALEDEKTDPNNRSRPAA
jgi:hypothetical protein